LENLPKIPLLQGLFAAIDEFMRGTPMGIPNAGIVAAFLLFFIGMAMSGKSSTSGILILVAMLLVVIIMFYYGTLMFGGG